jgi:hypothetical protein
MTEYLKYDIGIPQLSAIREFLQRAEACGAVKGPVRDLVIA